MRIHNKQETVTSRFRHVLVALVFLGAYTVSAVAPMMATSAAYASPATTDTSYSNAKSDDDHEDKSKSEGEKQNIDEPKDENKNEGQSDNYQNERKDQSKGQDKAQTKDDREDTSNYKKDDDDECEESRSVSSNSRSKNQGNSNECPHDDDENECEEDRSVASGDRKSYGSSKDCEGHDDDDECEESRSVSSNSRSKNQGNPNECPPHDDDDDDECEENRRTTNSYGNGEHCTPQQPPMPTQYDPCGTTKDTYTIPQVEGVTYKVNNQVVSAGVHPTGGALTVTVTIHAQKGSGYTKDNSTTLTFTNADCKSPVIKQKPGQLCIPGANNDTISYPIIAHVTYSQTGWANGQKIVTATADAGYYFQDTEGLTQVQWVLADENAECGGGGGGESMPVTPAEPSTVVVCGPNNDTVNLPVTAHVTYSQTGWVSGQNTITATAEAGYYFQGTEGDTEMTWALTDANTFCGEVLGETTTTPNAPVLPSGGQGAGAALQETGNDMLLPMFLSTGILGLAIMTMLQNSKSRRPSRFAAFVRRATDQLYVAFAQPFCTI